MCQRSLQKLVLYNLNLRPFCPQWTTSHHCTCNILCLLLTLTWDSVIPRAYANLALSGPARYLVCSKVFSSAKICCPENVGLVCFFFASLSWPMPPKLAWFTVTKEKHKANASWRKKKTLLKFHAVKTGFRTHVNASIVFLCYGLETILDDMKCFIIARVAVNCTHSSYILRIYGVTFVTLVFWISMVVSLNEYTCNPFLEWKRVVSMNFNRMGHDIIVFYIMKRRIRVG